MKSKFGINLGTIAAWPDVVKNARAAESAGFDSLWLPDHLANPLFETRWQEAWTSLAALAALTEHIKLGTLVSNIIYRHPALLAKQAITVDHISGGRVVLGIGGGGAPLCHSMTDTPVWSGSERQSRLAEYVELTDTLLRNPSTNFRGDYYASEGAVIMPESIQRPRPPLLIAAHGPRAMALAARYADSWNFTDLSPGKSGQEAADAIAAANAIISEKATVAGRDPQSITRSMTCGFAAASAWQSIEEAVTGIALFEQAGVNEFILPYSPAEGGENEKFAAIGVTTLLDSEAKLNALAKELGLSQR